MKYFNLLLIFLIISCKNNHKSEVDFMNCIDSKFNEAGEIIPNILFEQELALKAKGLISNNRSSDYIKLIKDISDKKITLNQFDKPTSISFEDLNIDIEGCGDFFNVNNEKTRKLKLISQLMLDKNSNIHDAFKEYNSVVNENDFNFTFYKLYTFIIINYYKLELQNEI